MDQREFGEGMEAALRERGFSFVRGSDDGTVFVAIDRPDSAAAVRVYFVTNSYSEHFISIDSRVLVGLPTDDIPSQVFVALNELNRGILFSQWFMNEYGEVWTRLPFRAEIMNMEVLVQHCLGVAEMVDDNAARLALTFLLGVPELLAKEEDLPSEDIPGEAELRSLIAELPSSDE